jgi:hypothetical protein
MTLRIEPRTVARWLALCIALLTALNLIAAALIHGFDVEDRLGILRLVDFNAEANIPTLYQTFMLFACAGLLLVIAHAKRKDGDRFHVYWLLLGLAFLYLGFDEGSELHELATAPARLFVTPAGIFRLTWVVVAVPIVAMFALGYLRFLKHLVPFYRRAFLACGGVFVGGAVGVEMLGGVYLDYSDAYDVGYALITTTEELLEKSAIAAFFVTLLAYTRDYLGSVTIALYGKDRQTTV